MRRFIGGLLFAVGALITTLSGVCTGGLTISMIQMVFTGHAEWFVIGPICIGIVLTLIGVALARAGAKMMRD